MLHQVLCLLLPSAQPVCASDAMIAAFWLVVAGRHLGSDMITLRLNQVEKQWIEKEGSEKDWIIRSGEVIEIRHSMCGICTRHTCVRDRGPQSAK